MPISKLHQINLAGGKYDETNRADLDALFQNVQQDDHKTKPIIIHFHGGLVSQSYMEKAVLGDEERPGLQQVYGEVGYPVFWVWQTGVFEIIKNNLREIATEKIFDLLLEKVVNFIKSKIKKELLGGDIFPSTKSISGESGDPKDQETNAPYEAKMEEIEELSPREKRILGEELSEDDNLVREITLIAGSIEEEHEETGEKGIRVRATKSKKTLMTPEFLQDIEDQEESTRGLFSIKKFIDAAIEVTVRVIKRYRDQTHHGLYPTVMEELARMYYVANAGKIVWDLIKQDAEDAFGIDADIYGGTGFLEVLKANWESGYKPEIYLVGHSAGSVVISQLLKAADRLGLPEDLKFKVVFSAPAVTFDMLSKTLDKHANRIENIRVFNLSDELEKSDALVPVLYPQSLLYFVSGVLEKNTDEPLVGMERYYSGNTPYEFHKRPTIKRVVDYLEEKVDPLVYALANERAGRKTDSKSHGDFNDRDDLLLESIQYIVNKGYEV